jgi:ribose 5-phosphate isomerase B
MRVIVAYDHRGQKGAECVKTAVEQQGHDCIDLGSQNEGVVDCPDFAYAAATAVAQKEADTAILLCTTGVGMSMSANKVKGVRAARCCDEFDTRAARSQFDANVLCLSGELLGENVLRRIIDVWLNTDFTDQERPKRLIRKIKAIEEGQDPQQVDDIDGSPR